MIQRLRYFYSGAADLAAWLPAVFWVAYTISNTVLSGPPALGPITAINLLYVLMLPAAASLAIHWRQIRPAGLVAYGIFMVWVFVGLTWRDPSSGVEVPKRILVYGLFGLGAAQAVARPKAAEILARGCVVAAAVLSGWTVWSALQTHFGFRAGTSVNPNFVATLIAPGLLVGLVAYFNRVPSVTRKAILAAVLVLFYALLLLESRGVLLALVVAAPAIWARTKPRVRAAWPVLAGIAFMFLLGKAPLVARCAVHPLDCVNEQQLARIDGLVARARALTGFTATSAEPAKSAVSEMSESAGAPDSSPSERTPYTLPAPPAPSVANTGMGAYGPVVRYYRIQWLQRDGDTILNQSPPGPATAFRPSGSGTAARVFRPVPPHVGETHWLLEQSADGSEWNRMGRTGVSIAQKSIDDSWAVSAYPSERRRTALLGRLGDWSTASVRLVLWKAAVKEIGSGAAPFFLGGGLGESQVVSRRADPVYNSVHNAFLQIALDFGLVGLALFAAVHYQILRGLWRRADATATLFFAGTLFWLCTGLTGSTTDLHPYWLFLGVAAAYGGPFRGVRVSADGREPS